MQHVIMPSRCCMGHHAQSLLHGRGEAFAPESTYSLSVQSILLVDVTVLVQSIGASVIDLLANSKIRLDSVKRMTQILNTS